MELALATVEAATTFEADLAWVRAASRRAATAAASTDTSQGTALS